MLNGNTINSTKLKKFIKKIEFLINYIITHKTIRINENYIGIIILINQYYILNFYFIFQIKIKRSNILIKLNNYINLHNFKKFSKEIYSFLYLFIKNKVQFLFISYKFIIIC